MYIYEFTYIHLYIHTYGYIHIYTCIHICTYIHLYMYICINIYINICITLTITLTKCLLYMVSLFFNDTLSDDDDVYLEYYCGKWFHINYSCLHVLRKTHKLVQVGISNEHKK
jgi:hypothetical protein